jgi:hypothetical protein
VNNRESFQIKAGPRNKSLATQHLEYIMHALLADELIKIFYLKSHEIKVTIDDCTFNITKILAATPDFEQLHFSQSQLECYLEYRKQNGEWYTISRSESNLHLAEQLAINDWTGNDSYWFMNALLRNYTLDKNHFCTEKIAKLLLKICIAASALGKPVANALATITRCYRDESVGLHNAEFLQQRVMYAWHKKIINHTGFTAASALGHRQNFFSQRLVNTVIQQEPSLNPIGKNIAMLSRYKNLHGILTENEVLFPPNTEFKFTGKDFDWHAEPVRSVNYADSDLYQHDFLKNDLEKIANKKIKLTIILLIQYLKNFLENQGPTFIERWVSCKNYSIQQDINNIIQAMESLAAVTDQQFIAIDYIDDILEKIIAVSEQAATILLHASGFFFFSPPTAAHIFPAFKVATEELKVVKEELMQKLNLPALPSAGTQKLGL